VAAFTAIVLSTVGLGFAISSLAKREPRQGLAIATIVLWAVTPIEAFKLVQPVSTFYSLIS
jgi:hypothetical protein